MPIDLYIHENPVPTRGTDITIGTIDGYKIILILIKEYRSLLEIDKWVSSKENSNNIILTWEICPK